MTTPITWQIHAQAPDGWDDTVASVAGGVFHTERGLLLGAPAGSSLFMSAVRADGAVGGVAAGVTVRCRIPGRGVHATLPTLPALAEDVDVDGALDALRGALAGAGVVQAELGSFDARYALAPATRLEYVVQLPPDGDLSGALSSQHRRNVRRGDRDGLELGVATGAAAAEAIVAVQRSASERAATRERGFSPVEDTRWRGSLVSSLPAPRAGLAVFTATRAGTLLSAILIGWAAGRAFYAVGGSTPEGFERGAAPWLHVRAMRELARSGVRFYNLGGTPLDASQPDSPAHGLYRFKTGFGAEVAERGGGAWALSHAHARVHRVLSLLSGGIAGASVRFTPPAEPVRSRAGSRR